jgi:hypothetical protein
MGGDFLPVMFAGLLIDDSVIALITNAVLLCFFDKVQEITGIQHGSPRPFSYYE